MPSGMPDSSPSTRSKSSNTGLKNNDGRTKASGWDNDASPFGGRDGVSTFADKNVDSMPNEGLVEIVSKGTKGLGEIV